MLSILNIFKQKFTIPAVILFLLLSGWWGYIQLNGLSGETDTAALFSDSYGLMALYGGLIGVGISKAWGGSKSLIGKAVLFASLGLLFQEAGQISYSVYHYLFQIEVPYPSIGDIGYFGSIIFYVLSAMNLIKALRVKKAHDNVVNKLVVFGLPIGLLIFSYLFFLKGYEFDFSNPLVVFLDFGYPLGQAIYISLALLAFLLSLNYLGGLMKPVIIFIVFAFVAQYLADFTFLYQASRETWQAGGINDYTYLVAYFVMTLALIQFKQVLMNMSPAKTDNQEVTDVS